MTLGNRTVGFRGKTLRISAALLALSALAGTASATLTSGFDGVTLTVTSDGADLITLIVDGNTGEVLVTGQQVPGGAPAAQIQVINITGGSGDNNIDLNTVDAGGFPALNEVNINGGGGADSIFGSQVADTITDDDGGDIIEDSPGDDRYIINGGGSGATMLSGVGLGNDELIVEGGDGNDLISATPTMTTFGGRSVTYGAVVDMLTLRGAGGDDTFVVQSAEGFAIDVNGGLGSDYLAFNNQGLAFSEAVGSIQPAGRGQITYTRVETTSNCAFGTFDQSVDCNANGVPDGCELSTGAAADTDANGTLDACDAAAATSTGGGTTAGGTTGGGTTDGGTTNGGGTSTTGGGTSTGGGSTTGGTSGTTTAAGSAGSVDEMMPDGCGAGMCGFGVAGIMPLTAIGLIGLKRRERKRRGTHGNRV